MTWRDMITWLQDNNADLDTDVAVYQNGNFMQGVDVYINELADVLDANRPYIVLEDF